MNFRKVAFFVAVVCLLTIITALPVILRSETPTATPETVEISGRAPVEMSTENPELVPVLSTIDEGAGDCAWIYRESSLKEDSYCKTEDTIAYTQKVLSDNSDTTIISTPVSISFPDVPTPDPAPTEAPHTACNNGKGNGREGCSPSQQGNNDEGGG